MSWGVRPPNPPTHSRSATISPSRTHRAAQQTASQLTPTSESALAPVPAPESMTAPESEQPPLHAVYAASVRQQVATGPRAGQGVLRLRRAVETPSSRRKRPRHARLGGFDLHADTQVQAKNRSRLERLCRYFLRPAIAEDRLSYASDGRVRVRLKTPWSDGTHHIVLEPQELLEKLAALIPRPYVNLIVYHGVLAPNAKWRAEVLRFARERTPHDEKAPPTSSDEAAGPSFIATIRSAGAIRKILKHHGLPADPVKLAPARDPPDLEEAWAC